MSISLLNLPFEYKDKESTSQKLQRFQDAGNSKIHLILDFDRTLTIGKDVSIEATSWQVMERHMPAKGKTEYAELFEQYRPHELNGTLTTELAEEWWTKSLLLLVKYKVNLKEVETTFLENVGLRPGTQELFQALDRFAIPSVILSAGVKDVIEMFLKQNRVKSPLIVSTELTTDSHSTVTGWHTSTMVHVLNKNEAKHHELDRIRKNHPLSILIGDSLDDANMTAGEEDVLRIRIIDQRSDESIQSTLQRTFEQFDLAILSGNLYGATQLVEALV